MARHGAPSPRAGKPAPWANSRPSTRQEQAADQDALAYLASRGWPAEGLLAEQPGNPWLHELKGLVLFEAIARRRGCPLPGKPLIRATPAHVMVELGTPALLRAAVRALEASLSLDRDSAFAWHQLGGAQDLRNAAQPENLTPEQRAAGQVQRWR